ncbi:hypothetical protein MMC25_007582 [Agyrium rufum]|nr:hypothetical protein [Agyrium rufum]
MESSPQMTSEPDQRRKSGRVRNPTTPYQPDAATPGPVANATKRKRVTNGHIAEVNANDSDEEESETEENDSSPDEEELKEQRRKSRAKPASKKPTAKRTKITNTSTQSLPMRPASNGIRKVSKSRKLAKPIISDTDEEGIFGNLFVRDKNPEELAATWIEEFSENKVGATAALVNFILRCCGCNLQLDEHDIEDGDNATNKLGELQDEYQAMKVSDYPLISKAKGQPFSASLLTDFLFALCTAAHTSGFFYQDGELYDQISIWITTMTSALIRPFRHTATLVILTMGTSLCNIAQELTETISTTQRQYEAEKKKKKVNQGRVISIESTLRENESKKETIAGYLKDIFDTVFIHRYRDVDPRIRVVCASSLGKWILACPDIFFEGSYMRYFGWILSDTNASTREEVLKQLGRIYKDPANVPRLRAFTEKFRPRLIEMATRDAEPSLRSSAIDLLDSIREMGLLEPDDIDTIGRLIFDSEARLRKAVANFFAQNINDTYESMLEECGSLEDLDETLGEEDPEEFKSPLKIWLKFKCIAEVLLNYDQSNDREELNNDGSPSIASANIYGAELDSRFAVAAQTICEGLTEVKDWEAIAGYLLFDHTNSGLTIAGDDVLVNFKSRCAPSEKEEVVLLELLNAAVRAHIRDVAGSEADKKGKKTKARIESASEERDKIALHLVQLLPPLYGKYGSAPSTTALVLRLQQALDLKTYQDLGQDSEALESLLEDTNKSFLGHRDLKVLSEARAVMVHTRSFEEFEEVTDNKLHETWHDIIQDFTTADRQSKIARAEIAFALLRASKLATVASCVDVLDESVSRRTTGTKHNRNAASTNLQALQDLVAIANTSDELTKDEEAIAINASRTVVSYFMWRITNLKGLAPDTTAGERDTHRSQAAKYLQTSRLFMRTIDERPKLDRVRLETIECLLDLHAMFIHVRRDYSMLFQEIPAKAQGDILASFAALERQYAKKAHKSLDGPAEDDPPIHLDSEPEEPDDSDDEASEEDGDGAEVSHQRQRRLQDMMLTEHRLCEFAGAVVRGIIAQTIDASGPTKGNIASRISRNKTRLGANFKEVLAYLDEPKLKSKKVKRFVKVPGNTLSTGAAITTRMKGNEKSNEFIIEEDDMEEEGQGAADAMGGVEDGGEVHLRTSGLQEPPDHDDDDDDEDNGREEDQEDSVSSDDTLGD